MVWCSRKKRRPKIKQCLQSLVKGDSGPCSQIKCTNTGLEPNRCIVQLPYNANIRYNKRTFAKRVIRAPGNLKRARRAVAQLTEEDPPGTEHRTCKDKDSPHDDDDYERLSDRRIEGVQGGPRPIHPGSRVIR